ncbi:MAG: hypothetical protein VB119_11390 [Candidatus Metalachnospira sp.]|nr:hypothetical protein [Candidatus Metalachnospira sp.]
MNIKSLSKIIGFSLFFISIMAVTAFGAEYNVNGQKYEFKNPIINENGVSYISIYDYVNITDKTIKYESEDSVSIDYPKGYFIVGDNCLHFKDGTSIKFYNAPIRYNNIMYVPLRMPKEIDSNIIMYDTKTGNTDIYNAYDLYSCVQKFKLNDYEVKADRLANLEKYISNVYRNFNAEAAQIDKSGYENGFGKIVYTAQDFPERTITVYFENGYIKQIEDTNGAGYVMPDTFTESAPDYVKSICGDFSVTIYAKDEYSDLEDDLIYAKVEYIGSQDKIYALGASPCFILSLDGEGYSNGCCIDDVAITYEWKNGEPVTYALKLYNHKPEKKGEYTITGYLDLTDAQSGKPTKIKLSKNIILK